MEPAFLAEGARLAAGAQTGRDVGRVDLRPRQGAQAMAVGVPAASKAPSIARPVGAKVILVPGATAALVVAPILPVRPIPRPLP